MIYVPLIVAIATLALLGHASTIVDAYIHLALAIGAAMVACALLAMKGNDQ